MADKQQLLLKLRKGLIKVVFLSLSVVMYIAYYTAISSFFVEIVGNFPIMVCIIFTYMFRLDILAAALGFWGVYGVWHAPWWLAALLTTTFATMSLIINHWSGKHVISFFDRIMPRIRKP